MQCRAVEQAPSSVGTVVFGCGFAQLSQQHLPVSPRDDVFSELFLFHAQQLSLQLAASLFDEAAGAWGPVFALEKLCLGLHHVEVDAVEVLFVQAFARLELVFHAFHVLAHAFDLVG